ncbi:MAG: DEAD/DEAH box helicase [Deltaproteobacteria bacterium]|jgi:replicative superfamily II helicase|nr:DEAD/DEAH box helicase [Deltaproteobacteria bacterium]MCK9502041.1 DEAD/DEAH box helicase [Lascolabacillus sp.]
MILLRQDLDILENHWAVSAVENVDRKRAHNVANARLLEDSFGEQLQLSFFEHAEDADLLERLATAYEIAAAEGLDALLHRGHTEERRRLATQAQAGSFKAFEIRRVFPVPLADTDRIFHVLRLAALAYTGDRWADLRRWLFDHKEEAQTPNAGNVSWEKRVLFQVYDGWLRLFRKDSWNDLHGIAGIVAGLRQEQQQFERDLLQAGNASENQVMALQLVALYHWAKATEQLSLFMLQGQPGGIREELDLHFEKAIKASAAASDIQLEVLLRWLHVTGRMMVAGSLWVATSGINSRVSRFVRKMTSASRPVIELLPPQRTAFAEQGLLDPASRAVVVDLPTSGGKTMLAQFRILQALNQFAEDDGWVAYVAPTRALVAQIMRRLRRDFGSLEIKVEQVSGGIEIDSFEEEMLSEERGFDVLISTPEKLGLIIRNGKLSHRPLALVVVDEAHNIEDDQERGLRIELLLATIRQDCSEANYLLLMPFVPHSESLSRWLDPDSGGRSISLGTTAWQPNERLVGLYSIKKSGARHGRRHGWRMEYETLVTTPKTIHLEGKHLAGDLFPLDLPYTKAKTLAIMTTSMAKVFSTRGTSIAVGDTIPNVWNMARAAANNMEMPSRLPEEIKLVQNFLKTEVGDDFELVSLLRKRVGVHHAGLPDEARSLIEWLAEEGHLRVLFTTTTIAQGINFPVSSVFISRAEHPTKRGPIPMTPREFWNLAGRAGRVGQDSVGVVGIAADTEEKITRLKEFVAEATKDLVSRLIKMIDDILDRTPEAQLMAVIHDAQWADFRSFVAHLLKEARNVDILRTQTEQVLRSTYGYSLMRGDDSQRSQYRATRLIELTNAYAERLSQSMETLKLADSTGFDPEGVRVAMRELRGLEHNLTVQDWEPTSLFGQGQGLSTLVGVMMQIPALREAIDNLAGSGHDRRRVAEIAKAWVAGRSIQEIATAYFDGATPSIKVSEACKGISRALMNNGVWGLAALSKLPGSGIDWDNLSADEKRKINLLPAFLYHGVDTEDAVLMRMNQIPRSLAKELGQQMRRNADSTQTLTVSDARDFVKNLDNEGWQQAIPPQSTLNGRQYREIWQLLSGEFS